MLDASTRIDVLNLLGDLKARGLGILFITHDLSLGNYISDSDDDHAPRRHRRDGRDRARLRQPAPPVHEDAARVGAAAAHEVEDVEAERPRRLPLATAPRRRSPGATGRSSRSRTDHFVACRALGARRARAARRARPAGIPWEERPPDRATSLWRSSRNPIIPRDPIPRANSIFNSAVVPYGDGFAGVFRVDDTRRVMNMHAGRSADGVDWEIDAEPIAFEAGRRARPRDRQSAFEHAYDPRVTLARGSLLRHLVQRLPRPDDRRRATRTTSRRSTSSTTRSCRSTATACSSRAGSATATRCSAARATTGTRPSARSSTPRAPTSSTGAGTGT